MQGIMQHAGCKHSTSNLPSITSPKPANASFRDCSSVLYDRPKNHHYLNKFQRYSQNNSAQYVILITKVIYQYLQQKACLMTCNEQN